LSAGRLFQTLQVTVSGLRLLGADLKQFGLDWSAALNERGERRGDP
jgi:hypothetical protein